MKPVRILQIALIAVIPLILLMAFSNWILEWLWLRELQYSEVFVILKSARVLMFAASFLIAGLYLMVNFRILASRITESPLVTMIIGNLKLQIPFLNRRKWVVRVLTFLALIVAFIFAISLSTRWDDALRFFWSQPYGAEDPVFGKDIGFYLFRLPLLNLIQGSLTALVFLTTFLLVILYFLGDLISARPGEGLRMSSGALLHIKINAALWLAGLSAGLFLSRYELLFRSDGVVYGAGYVHLAIELPALWVASLLTLAVAILLLISQWISLNRVMMAVAGLAALSLLFGRLILPAAVQQFRVNPNELELEAPYITNNIEMTRLAFGLDNVTEIDYPADDTLRVRDIRNNHQIIDNIRLWDHRLLIQTYRQLQEIRPYYRFNTVSIDRYPIDGQTQQVMLSARELATQLPGAANTWVNRHLQFTHGYGIAMSPVNRTNRQGEPLFLARDLPPVTHPDLILQNPALYYGFRSEGYFIVNSGTEELHYPSGDANVYHHYSGKGGIPFQTWWHRLLFAWQLGEINILLSDYITPDSRLQLWRGVQERIERITPFLVLDEDPYLVVHDGRLLWIQDAYTVSSKFPYSEPFGGFNYIRNPVKIVVDAYEGSVDYYVVDDQDPVIRVYQRLFPDLLRPVEDVPAGLDRHFRYPVNLFEVQLETYSRYHMTNPRVFYNNEDRWRRPFEHYGGRRIMMEPYYVLGHLPGSIASEMEFKLISPLTPEGRNNMIAWMAARCDPGHYGELVTYRLPKDRLIYGPAQIESRIDQDPEISRQLALWDQRGSRVIRGNLLVVPIENSFVYVEPVFLLADRDDIPQLQRVIVAVGDAISMQPTIHAAMTDLFGDDTLMADPAPVLADVERDNGTLLAAPDPVRTRVSPITDEELENIRRLWTDLRRAMQDNDWARYGELLDELDALLKE